MPNISSFMMSSDWRDSLNQWGWPRTLRQVNKPPIREDLQFRLLMLMEETSMKILKLKVLTMLSAHQVNSQCPISPKCPTLTCIRVRLFMPRMFHLLMEKNFSRIRRFCSLARAHPALISCAPCSILRMKARDAITSRMWLSRFRESMTIWKILEISNLLWIVESLNSLIKVSESSLKTVLNSPICRKRTTI